MFSVISVVPPSRLLWGDLHNHNSVGLFHYSKGSLERTLEIARSHLDFCAFTGHAQWHDMRTYLPDDLLVKTDIASMASSLELRAPFLDRRVAQLGLSLPVDRKISRGRGKAILREVFADCLPAETFKRSKRGFGVPIGRWLRGGLRGVLTETLMDRSLSDRGVFRRESLAGLINDHLSGRDDHGHRLWALLVLARWLAAHR